MRAHALIIALTLAFLGLAPAALGAGGLWTQADQLRNDQGYSDASAWRRAQVRAVVADVTRGAATGTVPASAQRRAEAAGLVLRETDTWVVLSSEPEAADGFYVIRKGGDPAPLVIEAPHAWYDLDTGKLACALFEAGYGRALLINSAQRHAPSQGDVTAHSGQIGADVAHRAESVFQAATLGVSDALNDPLVVQIHGFGTGYGSYGAVLSEGATFQSASQLLAAQQALEPVLGRFGSIVTGQDVPELSARTNVQGQAITGQARFLHAELSLPARRTLVADVVLRGQLGGALTSLAERTR